MDMPQVIDFLSGFAKQNTAPVQESTRVISVTRRFDRYIVKTSRGTWASSHIVLANGACNIAAIPKAAQGIPDPIRQITPLDYKTPDQLDPGGVLVVGASATGVQLAQEIQNSGRQVILSVGEHIRVPRAYRGRDIKWWMDQLGLLDLSYREVDDLTRARKLSSLQLVGGDRGEMLDLNALMKAGVEISGRFAALRDGRVLFSGGLSNMCNLADLKMNRLLDSIDAWIEDTSQSDDFAVPQRFDATNFSRPSRLDLDLTDGGIKTIVWATGYRPDYSWLDVPVLDRRGDIRHDGGIVDAPGMYVLGLPFLRKRKSTLIDGAGDDAAFLASHLKASLDLAAA